MLAKSGSMRFSTGCAWLWWANGNWSLTTLQMGSPCSSKKIMLSLWQLWTYMHLPLGVFMSQLYARSLCPWHSETELSSGHLSHTMQPWWKTRQALHANLLAHIDHDFHAEHVVDQTQSSHPCNLWCCVCNQALAHKVFLVKARKKATCRS